MVFEPHMARLDLDRAAHGQADSWPGPHDLDDMSAYQQPKSMAFLFHVVLCTVIYHEDEVFDFCIFLFVDAVICTNKKYLGFRKNLHT
ncbi:hypothetical protein Patl1_03365 [Pistacia atlantica]|uniref:Uncharacterized protein n=1 Tax=Pistacia atlantica TaxID=434234 RepID=A0ACC1C928_9ROSI|nr:hypothetical protein Patl1_03365 [Pistacia atlantica]